MITIADYTGEDLDLDPEPWRRCRCVSNWFEPDAVTGRCPLSATAEDGLCDHCRADACPLGHEACCHNPSNATVLLEDPWTPCEVPSPRALAAMTGPADG